MSKGAKGGGGQPAVTSYGPEGEGRRGEHVCGMTPGEAGGGGGAAVALCVPAEAGGVYGVVRLSPPVLLLGFAAGCVA